MKNIYLIVGPSCSGKTALVDTLIDKYGYKEKDISISCVDEVKYRLWKGNCDNFKIIGLTVNQGTAYTRMCNRGIDRERAVTMLLDDWPIFMDFGAICDIVIDTSDMPRYITVDMVKAFIDRCENE